MKRVCLVVLLAMLAAGAVGSVPPDAAAEAVDVAEAPTGPWTEQFGDWLLQLIPNVAKGAAIVLVGILLGRLAKALIVRAAAKVHLDDILWDYVGTVARTVILVMFIVSGLNAAGFPVAALLTTFGISGIIIGMGARTSMANYFAGVMMLAAKPFKKGDLVEFGPPPQIGVVREVKMTFTSLDTLDNVRVVVPNSVIWRNKVVNFSSHGMRAIRIPIGIPYDVDPDWVRDLALDVLKRHEAVLNAPAPTFSLADVTPDTVRANLVAWSSAEQMNVFGDVIIEMRKEFEAAGLPVTVPAKEIDLRRED